MEDRDTDIEVVFVGVGDRVDVCSAVLVNVSEMDSDLVRVLEAVSESS